MSLAVHSLSRLDVGPLSFEVQDGECVAVSGVSGSGKSLLLRAVADLDPHEGEASLDGQACSSMPAPAWRRQITYLASESGWWEERVRAHFTAPEAEAEEMLGRLHLPPDVLQWSVSRCSTGELQRLALVRTLLNRPRYALLDEPTSALDPDSTAAVEALLGEQLLRGLGIVMVTHEPAQIARLNARHLELRDGQLQER